MVRHCFRLGFPHKTRVISTTMAAYEGLEKFLKASESLILQNKLRNEAQTIFSHNCCLPAESTLDLDSWVKVGSNLKLNYIKEKQVTLTSLISWALVRMDSVLLYVQESYEGKKKKR